MANIGTDINREPIFWASMNEQINEAERRTTKMVNGKRITEKHPQHAHVGGYETRTRVNARRYVTTIRHDGHTTAAVFTCAAADFNMSSGYAQFNKQKHYKLGWFPLGACPCALLLSGALHPATLADQSLRKAAPCQPKTYSEAEPCQHALSELKARRANHNESEREKYAKYREGEEKQLENQRMVARETVEAVAEKTAQAVASAMSKSSKASKGE